MRRAGAEMPGPVAPGPTATVRERPDRLPGRERGLAVTPLDISDPPISFGDPQPFPFHSQIEITIRRALGCCGSFGIFDRFNKTVLDLWHVGPSIRINQDGLLFRQYVLFSAVRTFDGFRSVKNQVQVIGISLDASGQTATRSRTVNEYYAHARLLQYRRLTASRAPAHRCVNLAIAGK
jgi:hypothetical protein